MSAVGTRCRAADASAPASELQVGRDYPPSYSVRSPMAKTTTGRGYRTHMDTPFFKHPDYRYIGEMTLH